MRVRRKGCADNRHLSKGPRIYVNTGSSDVLRCQFSPDLHHMPSGFVPSQREPTSQNALSGGAPDLFLFKPGRQRGSRDCRNAAWDICADPPIALHLAP